MAAVSLGACNEPLLFDNVVPVVTGLGPVVPMGPDTARITLWVQDWEGDPVDLELVFVVPGQEPKPLVAVPGGHGDVGLTSAKEWPGREHVFFWDTTGIAPSTKLRVRVTPDDLRAGAGDPLETTEFTLEVGLPAPVVP